MSYSGGLGRLRSHRRPTPLGRPRPSVVFWGIASRGAHFAASDKELVFMEPKHVGEELGVITRTGSEARLPLADRISAVDFSFKGPFEAAAAAVHRLGLRRIDVSVRRRFPLTTPERLLTDFQPTLEARLAALGALGLSAADVFYISGEFETSNEPAPEAERSVFEAVCAFARGVHAPGISVLPGQRDAAPGRSDAWERSVDELRWRVARAKSDGLRLSVEPHVGSIIDTPAGVRALLRDVPGLSVTLDYSHFVYSGVPAADVHPLLAYSRILHVRQAAAGRIQASLGAGSIDFADVFRAARRYGFTGTISLEYVEGPYLPGERVDIVRESELLRDVVVRELGSGS